MASTSRSHENASGPDPWVVVVVLEPAGLNAFITSNAERQINGNNHQCSLIEGRRDPNNMNETVDEAARRLLDATVNIGPVEFLVATKRPLFMPHDSNMAANRPIVVRPDKAAHVLYYIARKPHPWVGPKEGGSVDGLQFHHAFWVSPRELCERLGEGASRERRAFYSELAAVTDMVVDAARQWCKLRAKKLFRRAAKAASGKPHIDAEYALARQATLESDYARASAHYQAGNKLAREAVEPLRPSIRDDVTRNAPDTLRRYLKWRLAGVGGEFTVERGRPFSVSDAVEGVYGIRMPDPVARGFRDEYFADGVHSDYFDDLPAVDSPRPNVAETAAPAAGGANGGMIRKFANGLRGVLGL